ncbi:MAG TPA: DUF6364 family protein [Casimicrobiaceae bacterium]|jgi:hypothetical protein|nr:DUF6364 family protein [Casimicrobiaceae bacterium]
MNLTLALDQAVVERARDVARQQGTSLNQLIREYVESLAGQLSGPEVLAEFEAMWKHPGRSGGKRFRREELYDERLDRYAPP